MLFRWAVRAFCPLRTAEPFHSASRGDKKNPAEGKRPRRRLQRGKRNRKRGNRISKLENTVRIPGKFEINLDIL